MNVAHRMRGFSLIEVLVSLIIISVGLLGIAKIQTIAYSETATSSLRSIAAIQASSMAASMRANRAYWAIGGSLSPNPLTVMVRATNGTTVTSSDASMPANPNCAVPGTPCSAVAMATYDVKQWATALNNALGGGANYRANIDCLTVTTPINCTVAITWDERVLNATAGGVQTNNVTAGAAIVSPTYTLNVQP